MVGKLMDDDTPTGAPLIMSEQYDRTITLRSGGWVRLYFTVDWNSLTAQDHDFLVHLLAAFNAARPLTEADAPSDEA